jgi:hypothetical protein
MGRSLDCIYLSLFKETAAVSTCSSRKPVSTLRKSQKLLSRSPVPTSSNTARAISEITSRLCIRPLPAERVAPREPSLSASFKSGRDDCTAGSRPEVMPVSSVATEVKASTRPSIVTSRSRGIVSGPMTPSQLTTHHPAMSPSVPPIRASRRLSVSSCRIIRSRPAPSAARRAISLPRLAARESCRLATLAHAIRSTKPTAPISTHMAL